MRRLLWLVGIAMIGAGVHAQVVQRTVRAVGEFSNMRFTEEHAYGYTVQLWRAGEGLVGLFLTSEGLQGDTPAGLLEKVKFDARTGALSFSAKLTTGSNVMAGGAQAPSRDLFVFSGRLKGSMLEGTVKRSDPRRPARVAQRHVRLALQPRSTMMRTGTYTQWQQEADELLRVRGPRW